ncbi:hypothetical protein [Streptomyces sp. NPDC058424]|uniref:hypothetical protein n=1 Tax=Streptomyces sp. NPDC058424 TaxID=3346491 RepID=UPI003659F4BF
MCLVAEQAQTIERLETRIAEQDAEIVELQRCLAQDSSNSSSLQRFAVPQAADPLTGPAQWPQARRAGRP